MDPGIRRRGIAVLELLSIGSSQILHTLLLWSVVLVGGVLLLGLGLFLLARHRFRRLSLRAPRGTSKGRVWSVRLILLVTQIMFLPTVALLTAVPFSLHRGAARVIESSSPRVLDWAVRTGRNAVMEKLSVGNDTSIVDLERLTPALRGLPPIAARARGLLGALSKVPLLPTNTYFRAIRSVIDKAAASDLRFTWNDAFRSAEEEFRTLWAAPARTAANSLRAASHGYVYFLGVVTVIVDLACVLAVILFTRREADPHGSVSAGAAQ